MSRIPAFLMLLAVAPAVTAAPRIAAEVSGIRHAWDIGAGETVVRGGLAGVAARAAPGRRLRVGGRLLLGRFEYEGDGRDATGNGYLVEGEATWGPTLDNGARVYGGVGIQRFYRRDQFADGDGISTALQLSFGLSRADVFTAGWHVRSRIELQLLPIARERASVAGERVTFDRDEGVGFLFSARFRADDGRLRLEPFLRYVDGGDSDTVSVQGIPVRLEDIDRTEAGLRIGWDF